MLFLKIFGDGEIMKKYGMQENICKDILEESNIGDIDNSTFLVWKSELQKELPSFWESMQGSKNNYNQDIISKIEKLS